MVRFKRHQEPGRQAVEGPKKDNPIKSDGYDRQEIKLPRNKKPTHPHVCPYCNYSSFDPSMIQSDTCPKCAAKGMLKGG